VWNKIDEDKMRELLITEHEFSEERVRSKLERLQKEQTKLSQKGLSAFF
jgi:uncharacterized membrane protein (DUF106 family)